MKTTIQILSVIVFGAVLASAGTEREAELWAASSKNIMSSVEIKADPRLDPIREAFEAVLADMDYAKTKARKKPVEAALIFRGADDVRITLKLKEFPDYTNIKIRVGWAGNAPLSREILKEAYLRL